jgi:hypothetical protein
MSEYTNSYDQPKPVDNGGPNIKDLVMKDMQDRAEFGYNKYGQHLKPNDGRDTLVDTYQEILDAAQYIRKLIYERDGR